MFSQVAASAGQPEAAAALATAAPVSILEQDLPGDD
jgi:hypothetical protein